VPQLKLQLDNAMQLSLISSFSVNGIREAFQHWPPNTCCELYCLMHPDLSWLFPDVNTQLSASEIMASYANDTTAIRNCAAKIAELARSKDIKITSFATYLPEVSHWEQSRRNSGISAAKFCVRLAKELRALRHSVEAIELVLGSRAQGVFPGKWVGNHSGGSKQLVVGVNKVRARESRGYALQSLREIATFIRSIDFDLKLALEMEPGPLNVLSGREAVWDLTRELDANQVDDLIGFNIDLAHWAIIANIDPLAISRFANRVFHAHISEHASGVHFGDLQIKNNGTNSALLKTWLQSLKTQACPLNFISVEIEAAKSASEVASSVTAVDEWLASI
jgi:sugar phosphate isomerase/epimerase